VLLKYGVESEGYWNSKKFIKQVEDTIKIVNVKYPKDTIMFFDFLITVLAIQLLLMMLLT